MTTNFTITETELEAIRSVERWIGDEMQKDFNAPSEPISDEVAILSRLLYRLAPAPPVEEVAGQPPEDSQGASVVDRGSKELEWRWAKETIGLTAVELNKAYAQFEITRDGCEIPSGQLNRAAKRLEEAMQRLGLTDETEIPF